MHAKNKTYNLQIKTTIYIYLFYERLSVNHTEQLSEFGVDSTG